jgi:hypothetical protein
MAKIKNYSALNGHLEDSRAHVINAIKVAKNAKLKEKYSISVKVGDMRPYTIIKSTKEGIDIAKEKQSKKHPDTIIIFGKINKIKA